MENTFVAFEVSPDVIETVKEYIILGDKMTWDWHQGSLIELMNNLVLFVNAKEETESEEHNQKALTQEQIEYFILENLSTINEPLTYAVLKSLLTIHCSKQEKSLTKSYHSFDSALKFLQGLGFIVYNNQFKFYEISTTGRKIFEHVKEEIHFDVEKFHDRWVVG